MSAIGTAFNMATGWKSGVRDADFFNDKIGGKNHGIGRLVTGIAGAGVAYKVMPSLVETTVDFAKEVKSDINAGNEMEALGSSVKTLGMGIVTARTGTFLGGMMVTALAPNLAEKLEAKGII